MNEEKLLADCLETYVREKHTQEECIGFIDGFKEALRQYRVVSCSCNNGIIVCPGCNGEQSRFGICAGCKGIGVRICGKCGGNNNI